MKLSKKAKIWIGSAVGFVVLGCFGVFDNPEVAQTTTAQPSPSPSAVLSLQPEATKIVKTKKPEPSPSKTKKKKVVEWTPESVYYDNCSEVRAAGKAPIHKGEPGYAKHLDRDQDGTGCDK